LLESERERDRSLDRPDLARGNRKDQGGRGEAGFAEADAQLGLCTRNEPLKILQGGVGFVVQAGQLRDV
jgi:hypothetical protein